MTTFLNLGAFPFKFCEVMCSDMCLQRGQMISENPVEEGRQKNIKSLLNKITPEKYIVIRDKLLSSGINSILSLMGLIDQVILPQILLSPTPLSSCIYP